jgi:hypothetical protein
LGLSLHQRPSRPRSRFSIPREAFLSITEHYYKDLGADLKQLRVLYDLDPRPGKAPLAYMDFVTLGRWTNGLWHPTVLRISANYGSGGLSLLNEFVHENGHAVHGAAVRNRPAFMDLGDDLFVEAFADVTSWDTYDPLWQQKYLGHSAPESDSLRSQYSNVMLDAAWALFELQMLQKPEANPNAVWTEITCHYLHIVPRPELSWWAVRVQLVDPGYMVNYGLGALVTADMRQHIRDSIGAFHTGNAQWYPGSPSIFSASAKSAKPPTCSETSSAVRSHPKPSSTTFIASAVLPPRPRRHPRQNLEARQFFNYR